VGSSLNFAEPRTSQSASEALVGSSVELHFAESRTSQSASEAGLEERSRRPPLLPPTDA
jgi:hypothetical protein